MIDLFFLDKNTCYSCKENEISHHYLCKDCLAKLDYVANKFDLEGNPAHAVYFYDESMRKLISSYKFNRNTSLARVFGSMVYDYGRVNGLFNVDYILPAPSSNKTLKSRGFDHIKLVCDQFIEKVEPVYLEGFYKVKNTRAQHELGKEERARNLKNAFRLEKDLRGKRVLLIDDLITTGNTALEIISELKKAQAEEVIVLAITSERRVY